MKITRYIERQQQFVWLAATILVLCASTVQMASAAVPAEVAARLDGDLTPVGAERGPNADGSIPAWTGGLVAPPPGTGYQAGMHHPDPFEGEAPLFTITPANMAEHADKMSGATVALMQRYKNTYFMKVYPTHRTCAGPERAYAATKRNALSGQLAEGGNGIADAIHAKPFPIPNNALEIIWNHMMPLSIYKATRQFAAAVPTSNGNYVHFTVQDDAIVGWNDPQVTSVDQLNNIWAKYIAHTLAPARSAGNVVLVHETINMAKQARLAWFYSPGTRRVRRAPDIAYDNPGTNTDGMATVDSLGGFNGSPDRYNWTVIGKQELYIPYNNYLLGSDKLKYDDFIRPYHINQEYPRYELHRVWVIEANLKPGTRHVYQRRRFYIDEDSWGIVATELYDTRGELWRVQENFPMTAYEVPTCSGIGGTSYDLMGERYLIGGLINEEPPINYSADELNEDRYTPAAISKMSGR